MNARRFSALPALVLSVGIHAAEDTHESERWRFSLTPYLWLPTISGDLSFKPPPSGGGEAGVPDGAPAVAVGPTDWWELLNGAALVSGSAHKGRFSIHGDAIYLNLKSDNDRIRPVGGGERLDLTLELDAQTEFDGAVFTVALGYALLEQEQLSVSVTAGVRYLAMDVAASWKGSAGISSGGAEFSLPASGSRERDVDLTDAIVGLQGAYTFPGGKWSLPYYLDLGAGSSDLTWQALVGVSRAFGWGDVRLMYRHLDYDEGSDEFLRNLSLSGPALGARFRF